MTGPVNPLCPAVPESSGRAHANDNEVAEAPNHPARQCKLQGRPKDARMPRLSEALIVFGALVLLIAMAAGDLTGFW